MLSRLGVAIGSGGVYSAAGVGALQELEKSGLKPDFVGGASAGAVIAALYYLEVDAGKVEQILLENLPGFSNFKLSAFGRKVSGGRIKELIIDILGGRNWKDGKMEGLCLGAGYPDAKKAVILTKNSGLSLVDSVTASVSLKMIEPIVKLNGKTIAHGGDPEYISGLRDLGAGVVLEVSPNVQAGVLGKIGGFMNEIGSAAILKGDYLASRRRLKDKRVVADFGVHPNLSLRPLISPLDFSERNLLYMVKRGRRLVGDVIPNIRKSSS